MARLGRQRRALPAPTRRAHARAAEAARGAEVAPRRRVAGGVVWIGVVAVLLAGVVALNVAVLRLNIRLDEREPGADPAPRRQRAAQHEIAAQGGASGASLALASGQLGLAARNRSTYLDLRQMKLANRRIRLVLAVFAFAFVAMFARAAWLQGVQRGQLRAAGSGPAQGDDRRARRAGTIFDRTGVQLAIGRQATTVFANPRQIRDPKATAASSPRPQDRSRGGAARSSPTGRTASSTSTARPTRRAPRVLKKAGILGLGFTTRSSASTRSTTSRRRSSAMRGRTTTASRGSSSASSTSSPGSRAARP